MHSPSLSGYATQSWVLGKNYITSDALSGYATQSWVNSQGYATASSLKDVSDKLNDFLEGSDTDGIINKWKELEAFLAGQTQTSTLADLLAVKADKATTLSGYLRTVFTDKTEYFSKEGNVYFLCKSSIQRRSGYVTAQFSIYFSLCISVCNTISG